MGDVYIYIYIYIYIYVYRHIYIERETERKKDLLNISINIVTTYQQHLALKWIGLHSQTKYLCVCVSSYIYIQIGGKAMATYP